MTESLDLPLLNCLRINAQSLVPYLRIIFASYWSSLSLHFSSIPDYIGRGGRSFGFVSIDAGNDRKMKSTGVFASDVVDEDAVTVAFAGRRGA